MTMGGVVGSLTMLPQPMGWEACEALLDIGLDIIGLGWFQNE